LKRNLLLTVAAALTVTLVAAAAQMAPEARRRARDLIDTLIKIQREQSARPAQTGRTMTITESDLNAYIAYRIETDHEKYTKELALKLLAKNKVEGRMLIDLSSLKAGFLLPSKAELFFSAKAETKAGKIRITMDKLYLGTQSISPAVLDTVIDIASRMEGVKPTTLEDWYDLPYGIQKMESAPGRLTLKF
jgi:hypothetical protein